MLEEVRCPACGALFFTLEGTVEGVIYVHCRRCKEEIPLHFPQFHIRESL